MNPTFLALKLFETAARKEGGRELSRVYWLSLQQKILLEGMDMLRVGGFAHLFTLYEAQLGR